jgi:hypothetical protein
MYWTYVSRYHKKGDTLWLTFLDAMSDDECPLAARLADTFLNGIVDYERLTG